MSRRADRPKVVVLAVHPTSSAATRLRAEQHRPHIEAAGLDLVLWTFFDEPGLRQWFGASHAGRVRAVLLALLRLPRLLGLVRGAAVVIVQREALPFGPPVVELLAGRGRHLVWDVDDSVWQPYVSPTAGRVPRWVKATGDKYGRLCRRADEVWAGSEVLAAWCRERSEHVQVVPTVVPVPDHVEPSLDRTVSWIGSHSTGVFVEGILPAVGAIAPPPGVIVVGAEPTAPPGLDVEVLPWSEAEEARTLHRTRVGLYPVDPTHPLAEGKCGLKAILYMAQGVPCVVTPTTTNAVVVRDGIEGLHARTLDEWHGQVARLLDDDDLWRRCSAAAHERARDAYSLQAWGPIVAERLVALAGRR